MQSAMNGTTRSALGQRKLDSESVIEVPALDAPATHRRCREIGHLPPVDNNFVPSERPNELNVTACRLVVHRLLERNTLRALCVWQSISR